MECGASVAPLWILSSKDPRHPTKSAPQGRQGAHSDSRIRFWNLRKRSDSQSAVRIGVKML
jgi:hypothetical protein